MNHAWRAALLTPKGAAAIAVIAIRGEPASKLLTSRLHLRSNRKLSELQIGAIHVADFLHDDAGAKEEVVIARLELDLLEIQCHGGRWAAESILKCLAALGAKILSAEQWANLEDHCPVRAAAHVALSQARTPQATRILLDQFRGALRTEIESIAALLNQNSSRAVLERLQILHNRSCIGLHLVNGFQVALLGKPNVGKSSLLNALLGYGRAIVQGEPGTTRDVLTAQAAFGGWPVTLIDLAGVRNSHDLIEIEGVRRAQQAAAAADLVLLVSDGSQQWTPKESEFLAAFPRVIVVHNKCDLPRNETKRPQGIWLSATTGPGLRDLEHAMLEQLITPKIAPGDPVPFDPSHIKAISTAITSIKNGDLPAASRNLLRMLTPPAYAE